MGGLAPPHSHVPGPLGAASFFFPCLARAWKTRLDERPRRALRASDGLTLSPKAPQVPVARNLLAVTGVAASPDPREPPGRLHQAPLAARSRNPALTPPRATEAAMTGIT